MSRPGQRAARASVSLEGYLDGLGRLPDHHAWDVLRDLTDIAAALPYLDHDLSEAVLPLLTSGEDFGVPYRMLTHAGHDALRLVSTELRARVPAAERPPAVLACRPTWGSSTRCTRACGRSGTAHRDRQPGAAPGPRPARADPTARVNPLSG